MCIRCQPLVKAIDAYLTKADDDLADILRSEGYVEPEETVKAISSMEAQVARALTKETKYILSNAKMAIDLDDFARRIWPGVKLNDTLRAQLLSIFRQQFSTFVPQFSSYYMAGLDKGLKITQVSKRTLAWIANWSGELARIMQLNSHREIETILNKGLRDGIGIPEFSRNIMDSGIRNEWHKARRTAVTEVLTAHRASQQEAFLQSPSVTDKMWRHTGIYINGPCQNHKDMDGRRVPKNAAFELLGVDGQFYHPMFPGDTSLPPAERIECHCIAQAIVSEDVLGLPLDERKRLQQEALEELDDQWLQELENRNKARAGFTGAPTGTVNNPLQDRRRQAIDRIRGKKIWQGLAEEQRDAIVDALQNGNPDFIDMAERCMDNCSVSWKLTDEGTSHYTMGTGHIIIYKEGHESNLPQTFWHEYGHYLDDAETSGSGVSYTTTRTDRHGNIKSTWTHRGATNVSLQIGYEDAVAKDVTSLLDDLGLSDRYYIRMPESKYDHPVLCSRLTGAPINTFGNPDLDDMFTLEKALRSKFEEISGLTRAENYIFEQGHPRKPNRKDFFISYVTPKRHLRREKPAFKGAKEAYRAAMEEYYAAEEEFYATHDTNAIFERQKELAEQAKRIMEKLGAVSDTLDGSVYGAFQAVYRLGGHNARYYATNNKNVMEGVANVFMAQVTGDQDIVNGFKQICPELYDIMSRGWMTHG